MRAHAWITGAAAAAAAVVTLVAAGRVEAYSDDAAQVLDGFAMVFVVVAFVLVIGRASPPPARRVHGRMTWTADTDRRLLAMYGDDRSVGAIAVELGTDTASVSKRLVALLFPQDATIEPLPEPDLDGHGGIGPAEGAYLLRAHRDGVPIAGIARTVGRTDIEVARFLFRD